MIKIDRNSAFYNLIFTIILFLTTSFVLQAQPVQVDARIDSSRILIGDQVNFYLDFLQSKNAKVQNPNLEDKLPKSIEIVDADKPDTVRLNQQNKLKITRKYLVTSFDTGRVHIPSLTFYYQVDENVDSIKTYPMNLTVQTVSVDTTKNKLFDIKQPFGAPISFLEILPYLGGLVGLAIIVLAIIYYLKYRKRKRSEEVEKKPSEPAHVIALRELDKLKEEKLWQNDKVKLYYTRLTDILRNYLWHRYDIKTLERTTDEILESLRNRGFEFNDALYKKLEDTLHRADLVKFAKWETTPEENERSLDVAYEFVEQTKLEYIQEEESKSNLEEDNQNSKDSE